MDHQQALSDFHRLTPDTIITVVEQALGTFCTNLCRPLNSYINRVYELEAETGEGLIVKFYRPGRWAQEALRDEHAFLLELAAREIPVIPPLTMNDGPTLGEHEGIFFAIFPKKSGRSSDEFTLDQWEEIGRLLARVHAVGATRPAVSRVVMTPNRSTLPQVAFLLGGDFIPPELAPAYQQTTDRLLALIEPLFSEAETIQIHGDCHFSNIIHRPGESFFLIDFDDMAVGPPVQDLWMLLPGYAREAAAEIEVFLEGYETFRPFDRRSLKLIEPLRAMRYIHYSAWCAHQATDGGLDRLEPDWGTHAYWQREIKDLNEQIARIREEF